MNIKKIISLLFLGCLFVTWSCSDVFDTDLRDNPNFPTPENSNIEALYNNINLEFANFMQSELPDVAAARSVNEYTMQLCRMLAFTDGGNYQSSFQPQQLNDLWEDAYSQLFPDIDNMIVSGGERGLDIHVASSKILKAYTMITLVDMFGDVPYSAAGRGSEDLIPAQDAGADVYAAAETLLNEAIATLEATSAASPDTDNFYGGDASKWLKAANSVKLKMYITTSLVDGSAGSKMMDIINGGNFIADSGDDFQFEYGSQRANPDSRHPNYENSYETLDGDYQSNYLMWLMCCEKGVTDPRIKAYYYRQTPFVPLDNINVFDCIHSPLPDQQFSPQHYLDVDPTLPYCAGSVADGYYGRDHGNGNGIPPDGDIRTVYGVYPAGGKFDNGLHMTTQNSGIDGALGQGIIPLIHSYYIDFWRAEAALSLGTGEDARALLESGVRGSIEKALNFVEERDPGSLTEVTGDGPGGTVFGQAALDDARAGVEDYVAEVMNLYDNSSDKLDVVAKEYLIAAFGNGIEGYNLYRRTGKPNNMQPMIQTFGGEFIRSALYPAVHVNLNANATQKDVTDQVFWDTNPPGFIR